MFVSAKKGQRKNNYREHSRVLCRRIVRLEKTRNLHSAQALVQLAWTTRIVHTKLAFTGEEGAFAWTK
jgi:hypothetical protein